MVNLLQKLFFVDWYGSSFLMTLNNLSTVQGTHHPGEGLLAFCFYVYAFLYQINSITWTFYSIDSKY